jgi:preprotein translocase subunit SecE
MSSKVEEQAPPQWDSAKWLVVVAIILGGVYANSFYATEPLLYRAVAGLVLAGIAVAVLLQTAVGKATWELAKESRVEIRKVVWPTRQETIQTTLIVVAVVIFVSFILWMLDSGLSWIIQAVIG